MTRTFLFALLAALAPAAGGAGDPPASAPGMSGILLRLGEAQLQATDPDSPEYFSRLLLAAAAERTVHGVLSEGTAARLREVSASQAADMQVLGAARFLLLASRLSSELRSGSIASASLTEEIDGFVKDHPKPRWTGELRYLGIQLLVSSEPEQALRMFEELAAEPASIWFAEADRFLLRAGHRNGPDPRRRAAEEGRLASLLGEFGPADGKNLLNEIVRRESEPGFASRRVRVTATESDKHHKTLTRTEYLRTTLDGSRWRRVESVSEIRYKRRPHLLYRTRGVLLQRSFETWYLYEDAKVALRWPSPANEAPAAKVAERLAHYDLSKLENSYEIGSVVFNEREYILVTKHLSEEMRGFFLKEGKKVAAEIMKETSKDNRPPWIMRTAMRLVVPFVDVRKQFTSKHEFWIDPHSGGILREIEYDDYGEVRKSEEYRSVETGLILPDGFFMVPEDFEIKSPTGFQELSRLNSEYGKLQTERVNFRE